MSSESTASEIELPWMKSAARGPRKLPHLVLAWSLDEPERLGEVLPVAGPCTLGRGSQLADDPSPRVLPQRMRPGTNSEAQPIANARISRLQLWLAPLGEDSVKVRSLGRTPLRLNGRTVTECTAQVGDVLELVNAAVFLVASRPRRLAQLRAPAPHDFPFGQPDPFGLVGESEAIWKLREAYAFAASTDRHVLLLGESGVGKELGARSIHQLSVRRAKTFVARNAATMPETLLDAELFGNVKNYPNPGMPERPGLVGEADGSTLFLDEIGDLPEKHQVHLLRVLDSDGEYQRLGEARARRSSLRLVAATNRPLEMLKHDFLARFTHRITIPGLNERRDDLPLLLAEVLRRTARANPQIAARFFERRNNQLAEPRLAPDFVIRLLRHGFTHHMRELERLVWLAVGSAEDDYIGITPQVEAELEQAEEASGLEPAEIDREQLVRALADNQQSPTRAAKALGLKNRYVLLRLMKKHGLGSGDEGESP